MDSGGGEGSQAEVGGNEGGRGREKGAPGFFTAKAQGRKGAQSFFWGVCGSRRVLSSNSIVAVYLGRLSWMQGCALIDGVLKVRKVKFRSGESWYLLV